MKRLTIMVIAIIGIAACSSSSDIKCGQPYTIIDAMSSVQVKHSQSTEK